MSFPFSLLLLQGFFLSSSALACHFFIGILNDKCSKDSKNRIPACSRDNAKLRASGFSTGFTLNLSIFWHLPAFITSHRWCRICHTVVSIIVNFNVCFIWRRKFRSFSSSEFFYLIFCIADFFICDIFNFLYKADSYCSAKFCRKWTGFCQITFFWAPILDLIHRE